MLFKTRAFAAAATLFLGAGCVPLTDYRKLEERYEKQEQFVKKHKDELKEFQKREQLLTMQMIERQKELEAAKNRYAQLSAMKSKEASQPKTVVVTEQPASTKPSVDTNFAGFRVNGETGGIVLENDVMFASGSSHLKDSGKKTLDDLAKKLTGKEYGKYFIRIDGHTDSTPVVKTVKENHDNWELGFKRAKAVQDYLLTKGITPERCFLASFGQYRPMVGSMPKPESKIIGKNGKGKKISGGGGGSGESQNRRVEVVLFDKK
jgi:outer membrane protein OmpA-like peptidoglycan-associated protein